MALNCLSNIQRWKVDELLPVVYGLIGSLHKEGSNYPMAFREANKGLAAARQIKDTAGIIALLGLKAMFTHSNNLFHNKPANDEGSLQLQLEGLKLAESSSKWERIRIRFYDNIAQLYKDNKDYVKSISYAKKGVELATRLNEKRSLTYGYNWLGEALYFSGHEKEGMACLKKSLAITVEIKQPFRTMELANAISQCYELSGDYKNALQYANQSSALKDSLQVLGNSKQVSELQIKYETAKKDKDIALLNQADQIRSRHMVWVYVAGGMFLLITLVLLTMYKTIQNRNSELVVSNAYVNEQSQKLQTLMQELHHRVKNNLQIVSSLLTLQSSRLTDADARNVLNVSRQRIDAMSIIHQSLYQHDSANMVNIREYIHNLLNNITQSFGVRQDEMDIKVDVLVKDMDVDIALPLGLILNEWVTNVFKHAYQEMTARPSLQLMIFLDGDNVKVEIKDNGIGMPPDLWDNPKASFGIKLMKVLMKQIRAVSEITTYQGTMLELNIPYC
jgi:two-component sensor histidine kinase